MEGIKCSANQQCYSVCIQKSCLKYPFMCQKEGCECYTLHKSCIYNIRWKVFKENIENKLNNKILNIKNYISTVEDLYKETMKNIQRSYNEFKKQTQVIEIWKKQYKTIDFVLHGKSITIIQNRKNIELNNIELMKKQVNDLTEKILKLFKKDFITRKSILYSKITEDIPTLMYFFKYRKINNFRLLYRASQHNFSTDKFHQICDKIPNTLVIAKTQFGKIMRLHTITLGTSKQYDLKKESFIFSLSQKTKIPLVNNYQYAIKNQFGYGLIFGDQNFYICDKSNVNEKNGIYINNRGAYANKNYLSDQNHIKLSGQKAGRNFKIIEWEVFQVEF